MRDKLNKIHNMDCLEFTISAIVIFIGIIMLIKAIDILKDIKW